MAKDTSVRAYLSPLHKRLVEGYAEYTGMSESQVVSDAVRKRFEEMPMKERERILKITGR